MVFAKDQSMLKVAAVCDVSNVIKKCIGLSTDSGTSLLIICLLETTIQISNSCKMDLSLLLVIAAMRVNVNLLVPISN